MSEFGDVASALLAQVTKLVKTMTPDDMKNVASGASRVALLRPGHRAMEVTPVLERTLKLLQQLSAEELHRLDERQATLVVLPKGAKIDYPLDPIDVASQVAKLTAEDEIVRFLDADKRLTAANLKKVATELNVMIPASVKSKPALQLHIAQSVLRNHGRWSWR